MYTAIAMQQGIKRFNCVVGNSIKKKNSRLTYYTRRIIIMIRKENIEFIIRPF